MIPFPYQAAGAGRVSQPSAGGSGYATWNPTGLPANCSLIGGTLIASSTTFGARTIRATIAMPALGYFECSFTPSGDGVGAGLATSSASGTNYLGGDANGYGHYLPSNDVYRSGGVVFNGATISTTPVTVGFAFNSSTRNLWLRRPDSTWEGGGDPTAGTSPTLTLAAGTYFPACTPSTGASAITLNAGASAFALWTPSGGFTGIL